MFSVEAKIVICIASTSQLTFCIYIHCIYYLICFLYYICKGTGSFKISLFCVFWLIHITWSFSTSVLIYSSNFLYSKLLQATYQYSQLSEYIIKLSFMHSLSLLQHSIVFQSFLVLSVYSLICFSILQKHLLNILAFFYFSFFILNYSWLLKYHHSLLM